jgi:peptide/nickel transport system substrate-binding protein
MDSELEKVATDVANTRLTRRELMVGAGAIGASVFLAPLLQACGSGGGGASSAASASGAATGTPKKGGSLRVGTVGGSAKESADGQVSGSTIPTIAIAFMMYDALLGWTPDYTLENRLAEQVTSNGDATKWTVRLKPDLVFHNGKAVTADDVVYSYKRIINPKTPLTGATSLTQLKTSGIRKIDARTVEFDLTSPNAVFPEALAYYFNCIIPVGFNPQKPIGTGPFKLTSFRPGEQIVFAPNSNYFGQIPWVDDATIIEFSDTNARVNALLGGTVDAISDLPAAEVAIIKNNPGYRVLDSKSGAWQPFTMRIDQKPFDDVRVRQAFKLMVDRQAMINQAYNGFGTVGNDMYAPFDLGYPKSLPQRTQDLAQAKSLLKAAGYDSNLTVTLNTSDAIGNGAVEAAQVFAQQATGAGVKVNVNKLDGSVFFGDQYTKWTFAQDFWYTRNYLQQTTQGSMPNSPWNDSHWKNDAWTKLVQEGFRTVDATKRNELVAQAAKYQYDQDGLIIWSFNDQVDAYSAKLGGVVPDKFGAALSSWHLNKFYFV